MLRLLSRFTLSPADVAAAGALLAQTPSWTTLFREAQIHGVSGLVFRQLSRHWPAQVPADWHHRFRQEVLQATQFNMMLLRELPGIHRELAGLGVPHIFFKGVVLAQRVYNDLAVRRCGDVDLLVAARDFARVKAHFLAQGFEPTLTARQERQSLQAGLRHPQRHLEIDLHFGMPPRELAISSALLLQQPAQLTLAGQVLPVFDERDQVLTYCCNAVKEYWHQRLYHYADLHVMLTRPGLDLDALGRRASALGVRRVLAVAVRMLHLLYDMPALAAKFPLAGALDASVRELQLRLFAADASDPLAQREPMLVLAQPRDYLHSLVDSPRRRFFLGPGRRLLPNTADFALLRLPDKLRFLYFALRPLRLVGKFLQRLTGRG